MLSSYPERENQPRGTNPVPTPSSPPALIRVRLARWLPGGLAEHTYLFQASRYASASPAAPVGGTVREQPLT